MNESDKKLDFIAFFDWMQDQVHETAKSKGWHETELSDPHFAGMIHSEVSEMLEAVRGGNEESAKIPGFVGSEEEAADIVIRVMDYCQKRGWLLGSAIVAKADFNKLREYKHGKVF